MRLTLIAVFGAVGTLARYGLQGLVQVRSGGTFPYGTLLINCAGDGSCEVSQPPPSVWINTPLAVIC